MQFERGVLCCGDGITALITTACRDTRLPFYGPPPYVGMPPGSTATPFLFSLLVYRAGTGQEFCDNAFRTTSHLPDPSTCKSIMAYRPLRA